MKICIQCEAENKETANFCKKCGQDLRNVAPAQENPFDQWEEPQMPSAPPQYQQPYQDPTERLPESSMPSDPPPYQPPPPPQYQQQYQQPQQPPAKKSGGRRNLLFGLVGLLVVLLGAGAFALFGPLNLWGRLRGGHDPVAEMMPPETQFYMGIDALAVDREEAIGLWERFIAAADGDAEEIADEMEDVWQNIEDTLDDEWGMSFEDDIMPWIGQYAGIGMLDAEFGDFGIETFDWVGAIEVRDRDSADAFITKLVEELEDDGDDFDVTENDDITIYELETDFDLDRYAFGRYNNLLMIGSSANVIEDALEDQGGLQANDGLYNRTLAGLPTSRAMTLFIDQSLVEDAARSFEADADVDLDVFTAGLEAQAMSLTLDGGNIRIDAAIAYDVDQLDDNQREIMEAMSDDIALVSQFPAETLAFATTVRPDLVWEIARELIIDSVGSSEYNNVLDEIENELGFNPEDVVALLNGEVAMGVVQSREGMIAEEGGMELGMMLIADSSDGDELSGYVDDLIDAARDNDVEIDEGSAGDAQIYTAVESGLSLFAFGNSPSALLIGSAADVLEMLYESDDSLADNDLYKASWDAHPNGRMPLLYVNLPALLDVIEEGLDDFSLEDFQAGRSFAEPIETITWSLETGVGDVKSQTLIIGIAEE